MRIKQDVPLKYFSTFKTGGKAGYFTVANSKEDIVKAFDFADSKRLPVCILGEGSNVLIPDKGFRGLVLKIKIKGIKYNRFRNKTEVAVGAGENWDNLVKQTVNKNLFGLENLSGISGSVGASPVQNIGAYGAEIKDVLNWVEVFDIKDRSFKVLSNEECKFSYRNSYFKKPAGKKFVITRVSFILKKTGVLNLKYKDVSQYFISKKVKNPTLRELRRAVLEIRKLKFPDLKKYGTAGSFFKNPIISEKKFLKIKKNYPDLPHYKMGRGKVKIPLAWVIDKICGLKGYRMGKVGIFKNQSIVLVNFGGATSLDIKKMSEKIRKSVKQKTGIDIEMEVSEI